MERNLGFFEAWRAKRKEKKNEELEKVPAKETGGILAKYLKMGNPEVVDKVEGLNGVIGGEPVEAGSSNEKENEVGNIEEKRVENAILSKDPVQDVAAKTSSKTGSRRNSILTTPAESRRSSFDCSSRRGSVASSLSSFSNIQERILTLSQEQNGSITPKKPVKVNKLSEEALKIGKQSSKDREEPVKPPSKLNANLQSKLTKFGDSASGKKSTDEVGKIQKTVLKKKTAVVKTSTVTKELENCNMKQEEKLLKFANEGAVVETTVKSTPSEGKQAVDAETAAKDSHSISVEKKMTQERATISENKKSAGKSGTISADTKNTLESESSISTGKSGKPVQEPVKDLNECIKTEKKEAAIEVMKTAECCAEKTSTVAEIKIQTKTYPNGDNNKIKTEKKVTNKTDEEIDSKLTKDDNIKGKTEPLLRKKEPAKKVTEGVKKKIAQPVAKAQGTEESVKKTLEAGKSDMQKKPPEKKGDEERKESLSCEDVKKVEVLTKPKNPKTAVKILNGNLDSEIKGLELEATGKLNQLKNSTKEPSTTCEETKELPAERLKSGVKKEVLQKELIEEAVKFQEGMTILTKRANQISLELSQKAEYDEEKSEASVISQESGSDSWSFRKDPKKLEKKLKAKSTPNECYPKTQKLLTGKPVNAFEQMKLEESKTESVISPSKVEAFLRKTLSPPTLSGEKEPVKRLEAVVEGILTSKSEKSKHEKPSSVRYTSRGEVICGVVSIKPSSKEEETDCLSAITLVPAFCPEKSILDREASEPTSNSVPPDSENSKIHDIVETAEPPSGQESTRECFSPISDFSDDSYDHYVASIDYSYDSSYSRRRSLRSSSTPRRIFPQIAKPSPYRIDRTKEESPVIFDAGLSFDIASNRTSLRHRFKPQPAFTDLKTTSNSLSLRISDFLKRTDHIMEEWRLLGKGGDDLQSLVQVPSSSFSGRTSSGSKSATNIMIKGLLNYSKGSRTPSLRSRSFAKTSDASDRTISDIDELSEMTLDLSEERATGTMQAERLEAETAERVRLEQELSQVQSEKKDLQQSSERLEMELFYARADVNKLSDSEADLEDGGGDAALYKKKCERAKRELEFTRRRLQQQHEDDLEQLVSLKKQLEKKLADAYEEIEEQRQVAAQWKRKVQKLQSETNDIRLLLEEQSSRNNLLEKKQRKFDSEIQMLQEELRSEKNQKERLSREKEMAVAEKYSLEQNLSSVRLELELKEEKVSALSREVDELSRGGGTEQEVTQLRKVKHDLEMKLKEQEEELDELAGQVSMLEANKLRLEMSLESLRKEHRREMAQRDDELDEVRANAQKKIKVLESQLESEHELRTLLVREKHELERRLADAEEQGRHHKAADENALQRARRDLKKTKALLRDAQVMLEKAKQDSSGKAVLRALKNQLEDAEMARASAVKAKQSIEVELNDVIGQLEEALRLKGDAENRCTATVREMNSLRTQVDENEEEMAELLKKYRQTVQQLSAEQLANQETAGALAEAEAERTSLKEQLAEATARLEANPVMDPISGLTQKKLEIRIKELESKLELEQTTRARLEVQITRLKENVDRLNEESTQARTKLQQANDLTRKLQRSLREAKEELVQQHAKEQEAIHKRKELEKRLEAAEAETASAKTDLRLAVKRIEDLQLAISGDIGSDSERTESDEEDSENDSLVSHVPSTISSTSRTSRTPELTPR